jgi:hypothetical protein
MAARGDVATKAWPQGSDSTAVNTMDAMILMMVASYLLRLSAGEGMALERMAPIGKHECYISDIIAWSR